MYTAGTFLVQDMAVALQLGISRGKFLVGAAHPMTQPWRKLPRVNTA